MMHHVFYLHFKYRINTAKKTLLLAVIYNYHLLSVILNIDMFDERLVNNCCLCHPTLQFVNHSLAKAEIPRHNIYPGLNLFAIHDATFCVLNSIVHKPLCYKPSLGFFS